MKTWNMHTVFHEVLCILGKQTFFYEVFERNDVIETSAAHFLKKSQVVKLEMFFD